MQQSFLLFLKGQHGQTWMQGNCQNLYIEVANFDQNSTMSQYMSEQYKKKRFVACAIMLGE